MKKLIKGIILGIASAILFSIPALAISNPNNISFGTGSLPAYAVFYNVHETGDMLFMAEGYVNYTVTPTDYTASQAFQFKVISTNGVTTLLSVPLASFGDRPIGIYQTASQVSSLGLTVGANYTFSIIGNPLIFSSGIGNSVNATLSSGQYYDNSVLVGGFTPLRNFVINTVATNMQTHDSVTTYIETVNGVRMLTSTGGDLFLAGIPNLDTLDSTIFKNSQSILPDVSSNGTGAYQLSQNTTATMGSLTANGIKNIGVWIGVGGDNGGAIVLLIVGIMLAGYLFKETRSPVVVLVIIACLPFVGGYLGLMSLAMTFVFGFFVTVMFAFYFFTRGIL